MRFIPSTEGPQVADRKPTVHTPDLEKAVRITERLEAEAEYGLGRYVPSNQAEVEALVAEATSKGIDLELSAAELYAEHTGNVSFLPGADRRQGERRTVTHDADGELWGPPAKLGALLGVAVELDALGLHRLAWRIRQAVGAAA